MKRLLPVLLLLSVAAGPGRGDEVLLRNGNVILGQVVSVTDAEVEIVIESATGGSVRMKFARAAVERISRGGRSSYQRPADPPAAAPAEEKPEAPATPAAAEPAPETAPAEPPAAEAPSAQSGRVILAGDLLAKLSGCTVMVQLVAPAAARSSLSRAEIEKRNVQLAGRPADFPKSFVPNRHYPLYGTITGSGKLILAFTLADSGKDPDCTLRFDPPDCRVTVRFEGRDKLAVSAEFRTPDGKLRYSSMCPMKGKPGEARPPTRGTIARADTPAAPLATGEMKYG